MNYTDESLRGGGGCCKNKNNKSFAINPAVDEFSTVNNHFSEELEDFQSNKDQEEQGCWNVMRDDDAFSTIDGEYESMNRYYQEDENNEEDDFLEQYLLSMSPIIDKKTKKRGEKGKKGTTQRTVPRRPHDVSVKCSDSTEEITGTPSEVALRLNEAIQNYLPRRKMRIEEEVSKEAAVTLDEEFERGSDEESVENLCPDEEPYIQKPRGCPGTYDRLRKMNVPCKEALTLREIALGRRIKRPKSIFPIEDQYQIAQPTEQIARGNEKGSCCGSKKKKRDGRNNSSPAQASCCTKQTRNNKSVSFSF